MKKKLFILLFVSNFALGQITVLDTNTILIGEQINVKISNDLESTVFWPSIDDLLVEGIEIVKTSKIDTNLGLISQEFIITSWDSGMYFFPSVKFSDDKKTKELLINVKSIKIDDDKLKDIKQPIEEPLRLIDVWPWILFTLIFIFIIYLLKKYFFQKNIKKTTKVKSKKIPADIIALKELKKLENKNMWQDGLVKEYYSSISEIIRRYIEDRFEFIALEMTTDEILMKLNSITSNEYINSLKTLLQRADLAKFAKNKPIDTENQQSLILAKEFIKHTRKETRHE